MGFLGYYAERSCNFYLMVWIYQAEVTDLRCWFEIKDWYHEDNCNKIEPKRQE